ncbi:MAG: hypothetical protein ACI9H6_000723 [Patiriisocius sp.]|jgi:hypothetical protein
MAKIIDQELLYWALCKTSLEYSLLTPLEQSVRPIRPHTEDDQAIATQALKDFRKLWGVKIATRKETGEKTNFAVCKHQFFDDQMNDNDWSIQARNLYSSTVSIYMTWDRKTRNICPKTQRAMQRIAAYTRFINNEESPCT